MVKAWVMTKQAIKQLIKAKAEKSSSSKSATQTRPKKQSKDTVQ
jgi:hypothetical protein